MTPSDPIKDLLDPGKQPEDYDGPTTWLWAYDPVENTVHIAHNENQHPSERIVHKDFVPHITHPSSVRGFAYKIKGGWRITDRDHKPVTDPYLTEQITRALKDEPTAQPKPHHRYHGMPAV